MKFNSTLDTLVIYHGNCIDGFGSALAVKLHLASINYQAKVEYFAAKHGSPPPDCSNKNVFIVDFSFKRPIMQKILEQAHFVHLIDHHISAQKDLVGLTEQYSNLELVFDMSFSGATLCWNTLLKTSPPQLFEHIQDRDIWTFKLDKTQEINAAIFSYPLEFERWQNWLDNEEVALQQLYQDGTAIIRVMKQHVERYKSRSFMAELAGYRVPVLNSPGFLASDLLGELCKGQAFAASYEDGYDTRRWQLRSDGEKGVDVSQIATSFGGGGHRNASGFSLPLTPIEAIKATTSCRRSKPH